jgi:hypothetical protein
MSPAVSRTVIGAANPTNQLGTEHNEFLPEKKTKEFSRTCLDKGEGVSRESLYIFPGVTAPHGEIPMT